MTALEKWEPQIMRTYIHGELIEQKIKRTPNGDWEDYPLAQPEPEPVAWTIAGKIRDWSKDFSAFRTQLYVRPVYTDPPRREWQSLTDEEIGDVIEASEITLKNYCSEDKQTEYARAIEAKLKERNAP